jgi:formamidopyrimidine-DNA glycosylase
MPELPEVQTIINELKNKIIGKSITHLEEIEHIIIAISEIKSGEKITGLERRGKYLVIITTKHKLIVHLRMTGKMVYSEKLQSPNKYDRVLIHFTDGSYLAFNDMRKFGTMKIYPRKATVAEFEKLGVEPLSKLFSTQYLSKKLYKKKQPIKNALLDQRVIAGLGNIYASEILFRAGIAPHRAAGDLTWEEVEKVVKTTDEVLREAIAKNGTTVSNYRRVDDKSGEFQNFLRVYQKELCCCGEKIEKLKLAGRSSYYCKKCQK